jgi:hypothetical protein
MENKSTHITAIALAAVMIAAGLVYLSVASDEYKDYLQESKTQANTEESEVEAESEENEGSGLYGPREEAIFFGTIGATYIPIGLWMLRKKEQTKTPYVIALIGSAALLMFYVATRAVDLPIIGLQTDVGIMDMTAKILQGAIVGISGFMLFAIAKNNKVQKLA